jgi:uncharacterized protein involved in outer membrane biogenesis
MKKVTTIVSIVLIVILMLMLFIPMLFKDQVAQIVKKEANKSLNAVLNFGSVGLNVFQSFPDLTLSVDNPCIINKEPFKGDTLLNASSFQATVDIWSVIKGKQIKIESIRLVNPKIYVHVLKDSSANYNITKETETKSDTSKEMNIALKNTISVASGETWDTEFKADNPGVWPYHCHIPHHMTNNMAEETGGMFTTFVYSK